jgi:hypothetical protein
MSKNQSPTLKRFLLLYTSECSLKLKSFNTREELDAYVGRFTLNHMGNPDYCVDAVFYGVPVAIDPSISIED